MKVSVKDGKNCEKVLKIEIGQERIQEEYTGIYRSLAPKAKIPGFRPGKAPANIVALHYKDEAKEQVLKNLLNESYREALEEHELHPLGYPEISEVRFDDKVLSFQAAIEVRPKIKLSKVKGLEAKKPAVTVDEKEIAEKLKQLQESLAQFKAVEDRPAAMGDFVIADYRCEAGGKELENRTDDWFELKPEEYLKGFSEQLVGLKAGEEKDVKVTFPEDMGRKEYAGKEAVFHIKIKEIKSKVLPEINDDLAKESGDSDSLAELKEKVRKELEAGKKQSADSEYEKALLEELVKKNKLDIPPRVVERRIDYMIEQAKNTVLQRGGTEEEFAEQLDKMREGFRPEAERQVHLAFLLDEIASKEQIAVTDEDVKKKFDVLAGRFKQPAETIEKYYNEHEEALDALRDQILNEKTIDFIKQNAK